MDPHIKEVAPAAQIVMNYDDLGRGPSLALC